MLWLCRDSHRSIIYSNLGWLGSKDNSEPVVCNQLDSFQVPNVRWWGQNRRETARNVQKKTKEMKRRRSKKEKEKKNYIYISFGSAMERNRRSTTWLPPSSSPPSAAGCAYLNWWCRLASKGIKVTQQQHRVRNQKSTKGLCQFPPISISSVMDGHTMVL